MNLWTLKNKIVCILSLVLILGLITVSKQDNNMPEDNFLSSGYSVIRGNMVKIDNYLNVNKYLKGRSFSFLEQIELFQEEDEYPQGLCITEDFVLISAYSGIRNKLGTVKIFDKRSGEYLISLGMDAKSHLGGLTYDGKNIWICNSSKMAVERIEYSLVLQLVKEYRGKKIDVRNMVDVYRVNNIPSGITYYDGYLWITTHSVISNSVMIKYQYDDLENRLFSESIYGIPPKVQGITFNENGEVYLSISYGRKNTSYIKKYNSVDTMSHNVNSCTESIKLPPCAEGIVYREQKLFLIFESAGKKYLEGTDGKGRSIAPINKILVIEE